MSNIKIVKPNSNFEFSNLNLGSPSSLTNQTFFSKLTNSNDELFLLTPICKLKNGIVSSTKSTYCDLMFSNADDEIITYMENLENTIQQMIYARREKWFHDTIEIDDIENIFTSPLKSYKSGKYFTLRVFTNSPRNILENKIKVYDQYDNELSLENINNDDAIMCVIHANGLKFSSKLFQIYFELKQVVVVNKENDPFSKNLIITKIDNPDNGDKIGTITTSEKEEVVSNIVNKHNVDATNSQINNANNNVDYINNDENDKINDDTVSDTKQQYIADETNIVKETNELNEVDISMPSNKDTMMLNSTVIDDVNNKKKELYYKAKSKAIEARLNALKMIAEANELKNTLLLENELASECGSDELSLGDLDELSDSHSEYSSVTNEMEQTQEINEQSINDKRENEENNIDLEFEELANLPNLQEGNNNLENMNISNIDNEEDEYSDSDETSSSGLDSEPEKITIHY